MSTTYVAVVDDDESVCRSFARLLRAAGIQPVTYSSAEAFLADTKRPQFDCMILGIELSGMSGIELAQAMSSLAMHRPPIVYITVHDDPETRASAETAGCAAYFSNSGSGTDVLETIRRLVA